MKATMTAIGMLMVQPVWAAVNCPAGNSTTPVTCTVTQDQGGSGAQVSVDFIDDTQGLHAGNSGGDYTVINSATLGPNTPIMVRLRGEDGTGPSSSSSTDNGFVGGAGGTIHITNHLEGRLSATNAPTSGTSGSAPGIWDDTGAMFGIYGASVGGKGGNGDGGVDGADGGDGGGGGYVSIDNSGSIEVQGMPYGGVGIYGASIGKEGGRQDSSTFGSGDQDGGDGGSSGIINIINQGTVNLSSSNAGQYAWGIASEAIGSDGGESAGNGGNANQGATSDMQNRGTVQVMANGSNLAQGVRGLYMLTQGGKGHASNDGSDNGGAGGWFGQMRITNSGKVTVISDSAPEPTDLSSLSGGIVMIGRGGDGGDGSTDEVLSGAPAGAGGSTPSPDTNPLINVQLNTGSSITTQGDYLPGVNLALWGGTGGHGRNDSDGGKGGNGGGAAVRVHGGTDISTDGAQSHGIVARSYGGSGGGHSSSGGIVDFSSNEAGAGGKGGAISVITDGDGSSTGSGGAILTRGDNSIGILGQSMGGIGGNTGYSFDWIYQPGNDGGNGGASGLVTIDSRSAITTYGASSHGIVGQSISGGGGTGGTSAGIDAVGGEGGTGAAGGTVYLKQSGNLLRTHGSGAFGMLGQSIGGGGGDGGGANGVAVIGGSGKGGGNGGKATIEVNGYGVTTDGDHAHGLIAQSIGGGGGSGGAASAFSASVGFSMAVAVGGSGDSGGAGDAAIVNVSNATITTNAKGALDGDANGVVVQSIGGGGGAGGDSVARAITVSVPDPEAPFGMAVSYALGGKAGNGGGGGSAISTLTNASVITYGDNSQGVVVQAIGGGGGIGGSATATSTVISTTGESFGGTVQSALGGSGGKGGSGGTAKHTLQSSHITTSGHYANAILLQSVGGGGGSGGIGSATGNTFNTDTSFSFTTKLGGSGGSGGTGGGADLTIDSGSAVTTSGDGARGAIVQSIGGGGGVSQGGQVGFDFSGSAGGAAGEEPKSVDVGANVSVGRSGAGGGSGGTIHVRNKGKITTYGADADGLLVQSIGGGGGLGGAVGGNSTNNRGGTSLADSGVEYHLNAYLGGSGGDGGNGGSVGSSSEAIDLGGYIYTDGDYADSVVVQSIGGGGGVGGASSTSSSISSSQLTLAAGGRGGAGGSGGDITAFLDGNGGNGFYTEGYGAMGIVLQSIGGGGGMVGSGSPRAHGKISAGGFGNRGGTGGKVTVSSGSYAHIQTLGDNAHGLVIQSIGGGGGIAMAGSTMAARNAGALQFDLHAGSNSAAGTTVPSNAPSAFGRDINVSSDLSVVTYGERAMGVVAQSIGGGGGIVTTGSADGLGSVKLGFDKNGSDDGVSAYGGKVDLKLTGKIITSGDGAHGIVAQSIGGGGGIVGDTAQAIHFDGKDAYAARLPTGTSSTQNTQNSRGGDVSVAFNGTLQTTGANAHGIVAQSIGGGGGLAGSSAGGFAGSVSDREYSGYVTVTQSGSVKANGAGSAGIFAQSDAGSSRRPVKVVVNGSVVGGSGTGSGVWVADGTFDNHLTINAGGSVSALSNVAVRYDSQDRLQNSKLIIDNYGTISGNLVCSATDSSKACTLNNKEGGVAIDAVAYKADVNNAGLLIIGQPGRFQPLIVSGDFNQSNSGVLRADVDFNRLLASSMTVQGDAQLAGQVDVLPHALLPERELTVLTVQGNTQGALRVVDSPVFDYAVRQVGQDTRIRVASADFNAPAMGLRGNDKQIAQHLQRNWDQGGNAALAPLYAHLDTASRQGANSYRQSVAQLSPGVTLAPAAQSAANLGMFTGAMMSCPTFTGVNALTGERDCFWGQVSYRATTQDASRDTSGFDYDTTAYQFGGQREVSPGWFVGGSVAYENSRIRGNDDRASGKGDSGYLGAVLKREQGNWVFSAALGGGYGSYRMDRSVGIPGYQDTLSSHPDVYGFNTRLRAARTFAYDSFYVKPYVDLDASYTRMPGYQESGSNPLALSVEGSDQFTLGLSPMIEIGGRAELSNGAMLRPFMYAGVSVLSKDNWKANARLHGAGAGAGMFETSLPIDDVVAKVGAGLSVTKTGGVDFRLQYDGQFSSNMNSHSATLKVAVPF